ncbi:hypothetical protein [Rhizobium sp. NZLR11]|uniref:hypothetical protein n=1 Tax=Rhizobium sp. NZLR11 TaxID=2731098 RepID=UPI001C831C48|nr:hypothetical protein [Rhizobium sp. NZLR11]MBX5210791.1 hypothetical protein [Rhizobium sp. NZLR11]
MEKDAIIKARISSGTKADFEAICQGIGVQPTTKARELIEEFVKAEYGRLTDRLTVHIYRPSGYDYGAWRVKMQLRDPSEMQFFSASVPFPLPELPKRRLHPDDGYLSVVSSKTGGFTLGGQFVGGLWEGHLYSNGVEEDQNPTKLEEVQAALYSTVIALMDRSRKAGSDKDAQGS